ncbi:hypothetical protein Dip510_001722 [Elusimicrobium posterum]|uniref:hypothetical protein n=1 Tax=Elusimicrobium posterum TaxID=3116653 RepID=UPI003C7249FD
MNVGKLLGIIYKGIICVVFIFLGIMIGSWSVFDKMLHNEIIRVCISSFIGAGIPAFIVWSLSEERHYKEQRDKFLDSLQKQYATAFEIYAYTYSLLSSDLSKPVELSRAPHLYDIKNLKDYDMEVLIKLGEYIKELEGKPNLLIFKITSDYYLKNLREASITVGEAITQYKEEDKKKTLNDVTSLFLLSGDLMTVLRDFLSKQQEVYLPKMESLVPWDLYHKLQEERRAHK